VAKGRHWGTVVAETANCLFVAFISPVSPAEAPPRPTDSTVPAAEADADAADQSVIAASRPAALAALETVSVEKFIKEACVFAVTTREAAQSLSGIAHPSAPAPFPVCVIHGRQHLPHLHHNHSSKLLLAD
jgi:hypothetical protein